MNSRQAPWRRRKRCAILLGPPVPQSVYDGSSLVIPYPGTGKEEVPISTDARATVGFPVLSSPTATSSRLSPAEMAVPRAAVTPPMLFPAFITRAKPEELEDLLRIYAHKLKSFIRTVLLHPSPELKEKVREMEGNYEAAIRQFYCRPLSSTSDLKNSAAAQPTNRRQSSAAAQPTPRHQSGAAAQPMPHLQSSAKEHASTSSTRCRERRKTDASAPVIRGPADASAQVIWGPADTSAPAPELLLGFLCGFLSEILRASGGHPDASAPFHATEDQPDTSEMIKVDLLPPVDPRIFQGYKEKPTLVLLSEPRDKGFKDELFPDPVSEGFDDKLSPVTEQFKERLILVLVPEPSDERFEDEPLPAPAPVVFKEELLLFLVSPLGISMPLLASRSSSSQATKVSTLLPPFLSSPLSPPLAGQVPMSLPVSMSLPELCARPERPPGRLPELCACTG
ncbi:hypothetical protein CRENBAI_015541 [Crenichthys baileyi]|uniref:Uncharacterized protein n=1 Tax=Crenichthys baileyi TaxID=28760 RepID=A0AAV9SEU1_9TELE